MTLHLALFSRPAFVEQLLAGAEGPEVIEFDDQHAEHVRGVLDQPLLNVVLIVATRYGQLTTRDLNRLTRAEPPWQGSRSSQQPIADELLATFFATDGAQDSVDDPEGDDPEHQRRVGEEVRRIQAGSQAEPDNLADLLAEVSGRVRH